MAYIDPSIEMQNIIFTAVCDALDGGSAEIYNGTKPATRETAVTTQTKFATLTLVTPAGSVSNGQLTFGAITPDSAADASGSATWARFKSSTGAVMFDCSVSAIGGTGVLQMVSTYFSAGSPVSIASMVLHF